MKVYKVTVIETVEKTYEVGVNPDESAWHVADTVYQLDGDNIEGKLVTFEMTELVEVIEDPSIMSSEIKH